LDNENPTQSQLLEQVTQMRRRIASLEGMLAERHNTCDESGKPVREGTVDDALAGKRAEEELAKSQAILEATIECLPFEFFVIGPDGRFVLENAVCRTLWGSIVGRTPEEVAPTDEVLALWLDNNRRAFAGERVDAERTFTVQGERRWTRNVLVPIRVGSRSCGVLGMCIDITKRKQAEESLKKAQQELEDRVRERTADLAQANERLQREAEERLLAQETLRVNEERQRLALEAISDGYWERDLETDALYFSPRHCALLGYEPEEMPKTHKEWERFVHPDDLDPALRKIVQYVDGAIPVFEVEFRAKAKSGEWRWLLGRGRTSHRRPDGRPARMIGVNIDITDRKEAAEVLRRSEERFRSYFVQGLIGMGVTNANREWAEVNDRFCEILGYSREELLRMKWTDVTHPDDLGPGLSQFNRMLAGELNHYTYEKRCVRKDGAVVHTAIFVKCFRHPDGTLDHILALIEDITERRRAQEALERERRTLEHMLRASDHERQLIAYDIHDGLAQYLTGAIMQLQHSRRLCEENPEEGAKAFDAALAMVRESLSEARRLISGVRPPILDESGVVAAVAHLVYDIRAHQGPEIEFRSEVNFGRLTPVLENAIYRIAQEGLTNACKHSGSKKVRIELVQRGDQVRIEISDQGLGFDPGTVEEGHFGLEGIRERARLLGGTTLIESTPGQGTRLVVEVPMG
jgi:PAS domain S-box-containing protein